MAIQGHCLPLLFANNIRILYTMIYFYYHTVAEYCEKWLLMQSAKVSPATLKGYASNMKNYIIKPLGDMVLCQDLVQIKMRNFSSS